ncbi:hypothetical protein ACFW6Q_05080 [Streptomyces sp. NPDC058737]|uniref:hypothetical protein n=1 Tax=Streptomyces sp. NPDC058737 TaxID=3346617 RepID=UPI0036ACF041
MRFEAWGDTADLDFALSVGQAALRAYPTGHPARADQLSNIGMALRHRWKQSGSVEDLKQSVSFYTAASQLPSARPSARVSAAWTAAELAAEHDPGRAADLLEAAVNMLPQVAPRRLERGEQQRALDTFDNLAGDAAAMALCDPRGTAGDRAGRALRLLEAGRAVLLSQSLETRDDLDDLREHRPEYAARFAELRRRLDMPPPAGPADFMQQTAAQPGLGTPHGDSADRSRTGRELAALLAEIRSVEGFASFGLPPDLDGLVGEAEQGPIVVFNVNDRRSDALLVTITDVTVVRLPHLSRRTWASES